MIFRHILEPYTWVYIWTDANEQKKMLHMGCKAFESESYNFSYMKPLLSYGSFLHESSCWGKILLLFIYRKSPSLFWFIINLSSKKLTFINLHSNQKIRTAKKHHGAWVVHWLVCLSLKQRSVVQACLKCPNNPAVEMGIPSYKGRWGRKGDQVWCWPHHPIGWCQVKENIGT